MNAGSSKRALTKPQSVLIAYLFESRYSTLSARFTDWIANSPRYAKFSTEFKDKIRKKIRVTRGSTAETDLLYELLIAHWLLQEKRFEVTYEPYSAAKTRGPDFAVTFRANFTFNIEVTHLRKMSAQQVGKTLIDFRLVDVLSSKLRQMTANMANLLIIVSSAAVLDSLDFPAQLAWIKDKAERKDEQFYGRHHFADPPDFFKHYERLSAVALFVPTDPPEVSLYANPQAKIKFPEPVKNIFTVGFVAHEK